MVPAVGRAANPFVTSSYTADPSAHVWADGRLYVYPSRDMDPPKGCDLMDHYHIYSTGDMVHWRDEGQALQASQVSWGRKEGGFMWAPDAAYRNGKYYFYFPHPSETRWNDTWKIGVAVSDRPASGFVPLPEPIKGLDGFAMIDPAVFVDSDGQAYIYFGGGARCRGAKLKENMVELDGPLVDMSGLADFHEATWVFKRNGVYYLTYADNHTENKRGLNRMQYATSDRPLGPWKSRGVYLDPTGCDTSHGSVVEYKGQWYQFYHNQSISGRGNLRSICVDKLEFDADGSIRKVIQTKSGPPAVGDAPASTATDYPAALAVVAGSATVSDGTVQNLHPTNASCTFNSVDGGAGGRAMLDFTYASAEGGKLRLVVNGDDWSFVNTPTTGGWSRYDGHVVFTVPLKAGKANSIQLLGGHGGANIRSLAVTLLDQAER